MEIRTKQRVIGGLVLLAVLAVFFSLLFCSSHPSISLFMLMTVVLVPLLPIKSVTQLQLHYPPSTSAKTITGKTDLTSLPPQQAAQIIDSIQTGCIETTAIKVSFYSISFIYLAVRSMGNANSEFSDSSNNTRRLLNLVRC